MNWYDLAGWLFTFGCMIPIATFGLLLFVGFLLKVFGDR